MQEMDVQGPICEQAYTSCTPSLSHANPELAVPLETVSYPILQTPPRQTIEQSDIVTPIFSPITPTAATSPTGDTQAQNAPTWQGFKLVGDNLDRTVHRRHQTHDAQTVSMHYFHYCGIMDRIDLSELSDKAPEKPKHVNGNLFLPTLSSIEEINQDFCTYIARYIAILCMHENNCMKIKKVHHTACLLYTMNIRIHTI